MTGIARVLFGEMKIRFARVRNSGNRKAANVRVEDMRKWCWKMIDAKEYLKQVQLYDAHIEGKLQDLEDLKAMATKVTTTLKLDAAFGSGNQDRLGAVVAKIVDLQVEINQAVDDFVDLKREVNAILHKIKNPDQLQLLYKRYFEYKTWEHIACEMHMTWRNACYIHGDALKSVAAILEQKSNEPEPADHTAAWIAEWEADDGEEFIEGYRCSKCGFVVEWKPGFDPDGLDLPVTCTKCKREMVERI